MGQIGTDYIVIRWICNWVMILEEFSIKKCFQWHNKGPWSRPFLFNIFINDFLKSQLLITRWSKTKLANQDPKDFVILEQAE